MLCTTAYISRAWCAGVCRRLAYLTRCISVSSRRKGTRESIVIERRGLFRRPEDRNRANVLVNGTDAVPPSIASIDSAGPTIPTIDSDRIPAQLRFALAHPAGCWLPETKIARAAFARHR